MTWSISVKTVGGGNTLADNEYQKQSKEVEIKVQSNNEVEKLSVDDSSKNEGEGGKKEENKIANPRQANFTLSVEPQDSLTSLHKQIEDMTGLKTCQQRLIYRGRLIGENISQSDEEAINRSDNASTSAAKESRRICDVDGLSDGQTIHLVPRPLRADNNIGTSQQRNGQSATGSNSNNDETTSANANGSTNNIQPPSMAGNAGAGLLAALLGIGTSNPSGGEDDNSSNNGSNGTNTTDESVLGSLFSLPRTRAARSSSRRRRVNSHLRTENDARFPAPGNLEPARQGLMTIHTMLPSAMAASDSNEISNIENNSHDINVTRDMCNNLSNDKSEISNNRKSSHSISRQWYQGQWLDCRDTVNQWLEATVVEIVEPKDILVVPEMKKYASNTSSKPNQHKKYPDISAMDPAIGANDFTSRRRLLLEPSEDALDRTLADLNNDEDLVGYQERTYNDGVQLLLIHYNGWPHRWDEWIRSDSERLRPFRTRSRHQVTRTSGANPTPQSVFHATPSTCIQHDDDSNDRAPFIQELHRITSAVDTLLEDSMHRKFNQNNIEKELVESKDTPEDVKDSNNSNVKSFEENVATEASQTDDSNLETSNEDDGEIEVSEDEQPSKSSVLPWNKDNHETNQHFDRKKLEALAPILDRLGRVLIDAAPHVAAFADSLPDPSIKNNALKSTADKNVNDEKKESDEDRNENQNRHESATSLRTLRPLWSSADVDSSATTPLLSTMDSSAHDDEAQDNQDDIQDNPDYVDFVHGFVNTSSNEFSNASRLQSRRRNTDDADGSSLGSSLLSAYLASGHSDNSDGFDDQNQNDGSGGPRVIRLGGGNGASTMAPLGAGGIDIHIHAIVTGPGGGGGAATALGGLGGLAGVMNAVSVPGNTTRVSTDTNTLDSALNQGDGLSAVADDDDDDLGLFSDLYTDTPSQTVRNNENEIETENDEEYSCNRSDENEFSTIPESPQPSSTSSEAGSSHESVSRQSAMDYSYECEGGDMPELLSTDRAAELVSETDIDSQVQNHVNNIQNESHVSEPSQTVLGEGSTESHREQSGSSSSVNTATSRVNAHNPSPPRRSISRFIRRALGRRSTAN